MTEQERQLVQLITQQVIAVLRERGAIGGSGNSADGGGTSVLPGGTPRVDIHPPIGTCTGDYSKFPELAGKLYSGAPANVGEKSSTIQSSPSVPVIALTGIVTASQLQAAMNAASDGVAVLAADARLSPLANDLARKEPKRVRRVHTAAPSGDQSNAAAALPWMWWIDGSCPVVAEVTSQRKDRLRAANATHAPNTLTQVIRDLASAIRNHQVAGGLIFVRNAARAMCLANRCASIRAVVGTCGEAVEQGVTELGANVLVVEYPHHGHRSTSAMVDRIMQQPPRPPASVERELADLHRCP